MKTRTKYGHWLLFVLMIGLTACSDGQEGEGQEKKQVQFSASLADEARTGRVVELENESEFFNTAFIPQKSRIRVFNRPDHGAPVYEQGVVYECDEREEDTEHNFYPVSGTDGFDWDGIRPMGASYMFEGVCFPVTYEMFTSVPTDQSTGEKLRTADLLLAHHRMPLKDRYQMVKLKFWHAFAMIQMEVTLPIATPLETGTGCFPADALQEARLVDMLTEYDVAYMANINSDELRPVQAKGANRETIRMCLVTKTEPKDNQQTYVYCGILPQQVLQRQDHIVHFTIWENQGMNQDPVSKAYKFTTDKTISLTSSHITRLRVQWNKESQKFILLTANVKPWDEANTEMILQPDDNQNETGKVR